MALADRLAAATARLSGSLGEPWRFRGAPLSVLVDRSPKPDRLPSRLLDLDDAVQAALITIPAAAVTSPPSADEYLVNATHRARIHPPIRHLGHAYECAVTLSAIA